MVQKKDQRIYHSPIYKFFRVVYNEESMLVKHYYWCPTCGILIHEDVGANGNWRMRRHPCYKEFDKKLKEDEEARKNAAAARADGEVDNDDDESDDEREAFLPVESLPPEQSNNDSTQSVEPKDGGGENIGDTINSKKRQNAKNKAQPVCPQTTRKATNRKSDQDDAANEPLSKKSKMVAKKATAVSQKIRKATNRKSGQDGAAKKKKAKMVAKNGSNVQQHSPGQYVRTPTSRKRLHSSDSHDSERLDEKSVTPKRKKTKPTKIVQPRPPATYGQFVVPIASKKKGAISEIPIADTSVASTSSTSAASTSASSIEDTADGTTRNRRAREPAPTTRKLRSSDSENK